MRLLLLGTALAVSLTALAAPWSAATPGPMEIKPLDAPAGANAAFPSLAADARGGVFMTWIETLKDGAGHRLRIAHRKAGGAWEEPASVYEGPDFWRNWADFPGLGVFADGSVMVHWLARAGAGTYDYNVKARISKDAGKTWGEPFLVNTDGGKGEHGFVSFAATDKGMGVAWLDGRETKGTHEGDHAMAGGAMTLRFAEFLSDGVRTREVVLDAKVCDCCQTAMVNTPRGLLAAYRDRSDDEFRDISLVRPFANRIVPTDFSKDGWKINACPVNGPALASRGKAVAAAWFTQGGGRARVRAALSADGGETFAPAIDIDGAFPLGRVDLAILETGDTLLTWLARGAEGTAEIKATLISAKSTMTPAFKVATTSMVRASGFPRVELSGPEVIFAWTEVEPQPEGSTTPPPSRVRTAVMAIK